jgi:hypothetical protein
VAERGGVRVSPKAIVNDSTEGVFLALSSTAILSTLPTTQVSLLHTIKLHPAQLSAIPTHLQQVNSALCVQPGSRTDPTLS